MADENGQGPSGTESAGADDSAGGGSTINSQVTDAIAALNAATAGLGPSTSAAMLGVMGADSIALAMLNAVARQQADSTIGSAALAAVCARLAGASLPNGAATASPGQFVAGAEAQAQAAIMLLKSQAERDGAEAEAARAALARVAAAAAPVPGGQNKADRSAGTQ